MYRTVQAVLLGILAAVFGLSALSRRFPGVGWLQRFRYEFPRQSEEQRERMRRRANIHAGVELILLGVVLPMGYVAVSMMSFNTPTPTALAVVSGFSVLLIVLGVIGIWRNRRSRMRPGDPGDRGG